MIKVADIKSALPIGDYVPFGKDINPSKDKLLNKQEVSLLDESGELYSKHLVETYLIKEGKFQGRLYHLFTCIYGRNILNYHPDDYYNLSEFINISFEFTIFEKYENEIIPVPVCPDYRLSTKY